MTARPNIVPSDTLLALAERCEQVTADEQGRLLDAAFSAIHGPKPERVHGGSQELTDWLNLHNPFWDMLDARAFLDAALTLVPEGFRLERLADTTPTIQAWQKGPWVAQLVSDGWPAPRRYGSTEHGSSPALALCAAALRARAAQ